VWESIFTDSFLLLKRPAEVSLVRAVLYSKIAVDLSTHEARQITDIAFDQTKTGLTPTC
jgi:hypothetical protein